MNLRNRIRCNKIQREAEGYLELGMAQHALSALSRMGDPADFDIQSLYIWGEALRSLERYEEAIEPLRLAVAQSSDSVPIHLALGWCYKRTGRLELAISALEQALAVDPEEPLLRYNLACYLSLAGNKAGALSYLSEALSRDPAYRDLMEVETDFDPLRNDPEFQALCEKVRG